MDVKEPFHALDHGIYRIDTGYMAEGRAACYLMVHGGKAALIETGVVSTLPRIRRLMAQLHLADDALQYVIPTHVHLDHAGGAGAVMAAFPGSRLVIHPRGARHMADPSRLVAGAREVYGEPRYTQLYGDITPIADSRIIEAEDGFRLDLAGRILEFRHSPGHANHHFVIWDELSRGWFTGDTFGISYTEMAGSKGRVIFPTTTPVQFDPGKLVDSIDMMVKRNPARAYLTHFGAVDGIPLLANQLKAKIARYCEFTREVADSEDAQHELAETLMAFELRSLADAGVELAESRARALLALDMELNAQGLLHWATHS